jgi:voltage-gated potassium channel
LIRSSKLFAPLIIICIVIMIGAAGFMLIERYDFLDALYMTVITVSTIGYQEVKPLSNAGKIFNMLLIISSFATVAFALTRFSQSVYDGDINKFFKFRRLMKALNKLENHVIICGFGRNGQQAAKTFRQHNIDYVAIDNNPGHFKEVERKGIELLTIEGNAYDDEILMQAGIERARAMLITLPVDADNVFVVLTARSLNEKLVIVSRANDNTAISKLKKAGADHVIIPDKIGGAHMAGLITRPDVIEFIEYLSGEHTTHNIGVIELNKIDGSVKTIRDVVNDVIVNVVGVKYPNGHFDVNPSLETGIEPLSKLFVLGKQDQINIIQQKFLNE